MPLLSNKDRKERESIGIYQPVEIPSFDEAFDAGVGFMVDESLSISGLLNNEMYDSRKQLIDKKIEQGAIPKDLADKYAYDRDFFDYDGLARELNDPEIKPNYVLEQERKEVLKQRRDYALDVQQRSRGPAFTLGTMTAAVGVDPVNALTLGVGTPFVAAKGLGVLAKTLRAGAGAGVIGAGTEAIIQPFVFAHKKAIDSPYSLEESLAQIGVAGLTAGIITGGGYGIAGVLRKVLDDANKVKDAGIPLSSAETDAMAAVKALADDLDDMPRMDMDKIKNDLVIEARTELLGQAGNKLTREEVKRLEYEVKDLEYKLTEVEELTAKDVGVVKEKGKSARKSKQDAEVTARAKTAERKQVIIDQLTVAKNKLARHGKASEAEAALSRLDQGILPERFEATFKELNAELVEQEKQHLTELAAKRRFIADAKEEIPQEKPRMRVQPGQDMTGRAAIDKQLQDTDFRKLMDDFAKIDTPRVMIKQGDDVIAVDGKEFMAKMDKDQEAIDIIRACYLG